MLRFAIAVLCAFSVVAQTRTTQPLGSNETFTGPGGQTFGYDVVLADLIASPALVAHDCTVGGATVQCLFVKKFTNAGCTTGTLHYGICNLSGTKTDDRFCMVTDEFSQVGLALAMANDAAAKTKFREWVNGVRAILHSEPRVPLWRVAVDLTGSVARIDPTSAGGDDASDATARVVWALFIASSRSAFDADERRTFRLLGDEIARAFRSDFVDYGFDTTIAGASAHIDYWLASGRNTGARATPFCDASDCGTFTFTGYFGDVASSMIAASKSAVGDSAIYEQLARDSVNNYLLASSFNGTVFTVPPTQFRWKTNAVVQCEGEDEGKCTAVCAAGSISWDDSDAVRAISTCRAKYGALLAGVTLPSALDGYCALWQTAGFAQIDNVWKYATRYSMNGARCDYGGDFKAQGLGASMFYSYGSDAAFRNYLGGAFSLYDRTQTPKRFKDTQCLDGYFPMFAIVNYGMGIGRDRGAYQAPPLAQLTLVATSQSSTSIAVSWTGGASSYLLERADASGWATVGTFAGTSYDDTNVLPNRVYAYKVTAGGTTSNIDVATTFVFTQNVGRGNTIDAADMNEIADAINELRKVAGLATSDLSVSPGETIAGSDIVALRNALNDARGALQMPLAGMTHLQPSLQSQVTTVRTWDLTELRDGLR